MALSEEGSTKVPSADARSASAFIGRMSICLPKSKTQLQQHHPSYRHSRASNQAIERFQPYRRP